MSHVSAVPESMTAAASELATMGANLNAAHLTAAGPTVGLIPAAADEISESIAQLFSREAQEYQKLAGQAASFHHEFIQRLLAGASAYAGAEAANASLLGQPAAEATAAFIPGVPDTVVIALLNQFLLFGNQLQAFSPTLYGYVAFPFWAAFHTLRYLYAVNYYK